MLLRKENRIIKKSLVRKMESNLNISDLYEIVDSLSEYPGISVEVKPSTNPGTTPLSLEVEICVTIHHSFDEDETKESVREELIYILDQIKKLQ